MIHYFYEDKKYFREDDIISCAQAKKELGSWRFKKLKKDKKCNIRESSLKDSSLKESKEEKEARKLEKLFQDKRPLYKIEKHVYKGIPKIEVWKKNLRFGYYNFLTYMQKGDEEELREIILKDIQNPNLEI